MSTLTCKLQTIIIFKLIYFVYRKIKKEKIEHQNNSICASFRFYWVFWENLLTTIGVHLNIIFVKYSKNDVFVFGKKGKNKD